MLVVKRKGELTMASTKEIFAPGLNYILREIKDGKEELKSGENYLALIEAKLKLGNSNKEKVKRQIAKIRNDLARIKEQIKASERDFEYYAKEYSYEWDEDKKFISEKEVEKYNIHPSTDEELEADYQKDLQEIGYDKVQRKGNYTEKDHNDLIDRVNEFNKANDLPLIAY